MVLFGLLNLAGTNAAGADGNALYLSVGQDPDLLNIGIPAAGSHVMGMADGMAEVHPFAADIAYLRQCMLLS
jgi:hypothetical protein